MHIGWGTDGRGLVDYIVKKQKKKQSIKLGLNMACEMSFLLSRRRIFEPPIKGEGRE